jgi:hypothetical protein
MLQCDATMYKEMHERYKWRDFIQLAIGTVTGIFGISGTAIGLIFFSLFPIGSLLTVSILIIFCPITFLIAFVGFLLIFEAVDDLVVNSSFFKNKEDENHAP